MILVFTLSNFHQKETLWCNHKVFTHVRWIEWENSQHFLTLPLVSSWNDTWGMRTVPFFIRWGGGGWWDLRGAVKNMALKGKGGSEEKYWVKLKGGGSPNNSSKFCSESICNNIFLLQTAYQNAKDQHFWHSESSDFPGEACPWPPLLYYTSKSNNIILTHYKEKSIPNQTFH